MIGGSARTRAGRAANAGNPAANHATSSPAVSVPTSESRGENADQPRTARGGIPEPFGRRKPDEREDGEDPRIVGQRGALVGPEKRAREDTADALPRRHWLPVQRQIGVIN